MRESFEWYLNYLNMKIIVFSQQSCIFCFVWVTLLNYGLALLLNRIAVKKQLTSLQKLIASLHLKAAILTKWYHFWGTFNVAVCCLAAFKLSVVCRRSENSFSTRGSDEISRVCLYPNWSNLFRKTLYFSSPKPMQAI